MTTKIITLKDVCEECPCKSNEEYYIDMTDFYPEDHIYSDIITHLRSVNIGGVDVTVLDLFNFPADTDEKIIEFIKERTGIDITTSDGISKINSLFEEAVNFYERRYLRNVPLRLKRLKFTTTQSIINFLKETKTNKTSGIINCAIAKVVYVVSDIIQNEKIRRALFLDRQFISQYLERPFQIEERGEDKNGNIYRTGKVSIDGRVIRFKMISRHKQRDSIIGKQLSDPKYYSIDKFRDLVGVTIYVKHDRQAALIMQYIDQFIYGGKARIKNKNGLDLEAVKNHVHLNRDFYLKLEKETEIAPYEISEEECEEEECGCEREEFERKKEFDKRKNITHKNYREIKLVGRVDLSLEEGSRSSKYPIGTEIKFVVGGHDNGKGLCLHAVYNYLKRFRELTRLGIPIRKIDIVNYVNDFFENLEENLRRENKTRKEYLNELYEDLRELGLLDEEKVQSKKSENFLKTLALGLYRYFLSKLIRVKFPGSKKEYFFDERILKLRDIGLYKEFHKI